MGPESVDSFAAIAGLRRARARAEAAEWDGLLAARDQGFHDARGYDHPLTQRLERDGTILSIAQLDGLSEGQVRERLAQADRVLERAPGIWSAFRDGRLDAAMVREISHTLAKLERPRSWARLESRAVAYAADHTLAELRAWLKRFVRRTEPDLAVQRANTAREQRFVDIRHDDDSMAWLTGYLPSHHAAAIDAHLTALANLTGHAADPDDHRTQAQRRADAATELLTTPHHANPDTDPGALGAVTRVDIAVTISADVLAGNTPGFAEAADGSWGVPAEWLHHLITDGGPFWHRMILHPTTGNVLTHEYAGRFAPDTLARAIRFRDSVCQAPGCLTPAHRCDLDHQQPWPHGPTTGTNMWALCRRHHNLKSHGILTLTPPHPAPPETCPAGPG